MNDAIRHMEARLRHLEQSNADLTERLDKAFRRLARGESSLRDIGERQSYQSVEIADVARRQR